MKTIIRSSDGRFFGREIPIPYPGLVFSLDDAIFKVIAVSGNMVFCDFNTFYVE